MTDNHSIHEDALSLLLEAIGDFCDVNEIAQKKDRHLFLRTSGSFFAKAPHGGLSYSTTLEDVARDLFYSPGLIPQKITMCLEDFLSSEQGKRADSRELFDYFSSDEATVLFEQKRNNMATHNNQIVHEVIIGNMARGWTMSFIGNYGEYSRRDYDVRAVFSVTVGMNREELSTRLASRIEKWARVEVVSLANSVQQTIKNLPANLQHLVWEQLINQYHQNETLSPLSALHKKRELREVISRNFLDQSGSEGETNNKQPEKSATSHKHQERSNDPEHTDDGGQGKTRRKM